ncbi:hypothetical protein ABHN11_12830 [Brevibacillus centrosporus]|uniref:hypothetical protein n=1 Tax=Brevibacillus centrosporus TaxID=54910 RepID=UPI003D1C6F4A
MSIVRKADFYFGSMLSGLINNGLAPAIIEPGESRRIYSIATDKGDYLVYAKYVSAPLKRQNKETQLWQFVFSPDEIDYIQNFEENNKSIYFALICGQERLQDSEIAILTLGEAKDCLDLKFKRDSYRITIKSEKGIHGLKAYGTGRADILDGKDNTIRVPRDMLACF